MDVAELDVPVDRGQRAADLGARLVHGAPLDHLEDGVRRRPRPQERRDVRRRLAERPASRTRIRIFQLIARRRRPVNSVHSQASNDDVEHGGEGLAAVGNPLVDDDAGEPNEQCPGEEKHRVHGAEAEALGAVICGVQDPRRRGFFLFFWSCKPPRQKPGTSTPGSMASRRVTLTPRSMASTHWIQN